MIALGLGSNIAGRNNTREENIISALKLLDSHEKIKIKKISPLYESEPLGVTAQDKFLNCAVIVVTTLSPENLLAVCLFIESQMGRERCVRWGPRNIDIDLLFYDNTVIKSKSIELPHPRMHERKFVLMPLFDIAAYFPVYKGMTSGELLELTEDKSTVKRYCSPVFEEFINMFEKSGE
jgi:2-amino-4-hydroxy-6-hydroxymethyldihydropteridine diphosphokinase